MRESPRISLSSIDCIVRSYLIAGSSMPLASITAPFVLQAVDRCHRLGQTKDVGVVKLVTRLDNGDATVEERIIQMQACVRLVLYANSLNLLVLSCSARDTVHPCNIGKPCICI